MGPILERVVDETDGQVALVKINVDENPQASAAFRVQGIPAVYALRDGKVDRRVRRAPRVRPQVRGFIDRLLPSEAEVEVAALLAAGDEASLRQALELDPGNESAIVALGDLWSTHGRPDEALTLLERIPETAATRQVAARARAGAVADDIDDVGPRLDALLDQVKARRRGPPAVRRPAGAARSRRPAHGRLPPQAHRPPVLSAGRLPTLGG